MRDPADSYWHLARLLVLHAAERDRLLETYEFGGWTVTIRSIRHIEEVRPRG